MKDFEKELLSLRRDVDEIKKRNRRVELDKSWETSRVRVFSIAMITLLFVTGFMFVIGDSRPFLKGIVAAVGYILSSETYGVLKKWWLKR